MKTETQLTFSQKKELRNLYGEFQDVKNNCDTFQERKELREEIRTEYAEKFTELWEETDITELPELIYSANQLKFIEDAEEQGHEIDYCYGGRGMFGDVCPAVRCDSHNDLTTTAETRIDSMGLGIVIYAQN